MGYCVSGWWKGVGALWGTVRYRGLRFTPSLSLGGTCKVNNLTPGCSRCATRPVLPAGTTVGSLPLLAEAIQGNNQGITNPCRCRCTGTMCVLLITAVCTETAVFVQKGKCFEERVPGLIFFWVDQPQDVARKMAEVFLKKMSKPTYFEPICGGGCIFHCPFLKGWYDVNGDEWFDGCLGKQQRRVATTLTMSWPCHSIEDNP